MRRFVSVAISVLVVAGCSIRQTAVDFIGDAVAGGGGVYESDDDPRLVQDALPFGLKTYESLLAVSPAHMGLLLATAKGFVSYAYLLELEADRLDDTDLPRAREQRVRASKLFLRGRDYALRGLEVSHPGFRADLRRDSAAALAKATKDDAPYLYWAGAGWAAALGADKDNLDLVAELPTAGALVGRVLELDEGFESGAAHEFFIAYEGGRPNGDLKAARSHYERALALSNGERASVFVALAESVSVRQQNVAEFRALLTKALAVDPDKAPQIRLVNVIAQERARWLQQRIPLLFAGADLTE